MKYTNLLKNEFSIRIHLSSFKVENAGEYHAVIEGTDPLLSAEIQYQNIREGIHYLIEKILPETCELVLKRYFVSDAANHEAFLKRAADKEAAVSIVQQPPMNGTKVALWAYFVENARMAPNGENAVAMERSAYRHLYDMQLHQHNHNSSELRQTVKILHNYADKLEKEGCTLADHVIRTWIFVQGVDTHYAGMVKARKLYFEEQGLTEHTHYIASTGIEGKYLHPETTVLMDAYAIRGLRPDQVTYLKGATHLNPTHEYGVTFERATAVDYGDRRHVFISGTASIDNKGEIVHPYNVGQQTERTLENIAVLLHEGGMEMTDIAQMIVYLRDTADYWTVEPYLDTHYPSIPKVIVWAPVCRPGWLIEIECIAIKRTQHEQFPAF